MKTGVSDANTRNTNTVEINMPKNTSFLAPHPEKIRIFDMSMMTSKTGRERRHLWKSRLQPAYIKKINSALFLAYIEDNSLSLQDNL
jgi:hypothetical protein